MSFLDNIFGHDKEDAPTSMMTPEQQAAQKSLLSSSLPAATNYLGNTGKAYQGAMTTPYEQQGLKQLGSYLDSPNMTQDPLYGQAKDELSKTLGGGYDIGGTYYDAYKQAVMRELRQAKDRLAAETSSSDRLFGGGRIQSAGQLEEGATNNLAMQLGQMYENERTRRLGAVGQSTDLLNAGNQDILNRVGASQQYGSLPFTRDYNEYIRQMTEAGIPLQTALQLATAQNEYYQPSYQPSQFEQAAQTIAPLMMGVGSIIPG